MSASPLSLVHTEGESNTSPARAEWAARQQDRVTTELLRRDADAFLHQSLSSPCVSAIAKAEGIWIEDTTGRRYMDFHGNSVHHIGYGHPRLKAAITAQMDELCFAPRRFTCERAVELAETLGRLAPGTLDKVLFTTGGSDAVEVALKLARAATGRFKTLSFWDAFHGAGFGAASVGGEATFRSGIAGPLLPGAEHVAPWAPHGCAYGHDNLEDSARACASMIAYVLGREGDIAAFIAEPMRATPLVPAPGFWKAVREACDRHGTLLIFDEIPTGLGKTGRFFASEHDGVTPDMIVLGKALGGGILPVSAVVANRDVLGVIRPGEHGSTFGGSPLAAAVGTRVVEMLSTGEFQRRAAALGEHLEAKLAELVGHGVTGVRVAGLWAGVDIDPAQGTGRQIAERLLGRGVLVKDTHGQTIRIAPPLVIRGTELDWAVEQLRLVLAG